MPDPDDSPADARSDLRQLASEGSVWWRAVCIPGWMWRKVAVHEPVSTSLQIAGVNVLLKDYGHSPTELPEHLDKVEPSSSSSTTNATSSGFEGGAPSQAGFAQQPGFVPQQPGLLPQQTGFVPQQHDHFRLGFVASGLKTDQPPALDRPSPVKTMQTSAQPPTVTHTLLRQWGAEVSVRVLPVGWSQPKQSEAEQQGSASQEVSAPGQPFHLLSHGRGFARLNSIWESPEASEADDSSPTHSSVKSLFHGHPSIQKSAVVQKAKAAAEQQPGSPGAAFTHRQSNPLCKHLSHVL